MGFDLVSCSVNPRYCQLSVHPGGCVCFCLSTIGCQENGRKVGEKEISVCVYFLPFSLFLVLVFFSCYISDVHLNSFPNHTFILLKMI